MYGIIHVWYLEGALLLLWNPQRCEHVTVKYTTKNHRIGLSLFQQLTFHCQRPENKEEK